MLEVIKGLLALAGVLMGTIGLFIVGGQLVLWARSWKRAWCKRRTS